MLLTHGHGHASRMRHYRNRFLAEPVPRQSGAAFVLLALIAAAWPGRTQGQAVRTPSRRASILTSTAHVIPPVEDNRSPALTSYRRIILAIKP